MNDEVIQPPIERRRSADHEASSIKSDIRHMAEAIDKLGRVVSEMHEDLTKIAVHDERLSTMTLAQERAFAEIDKIQKKVGDHMVDEKTPHPLYSRFIWIGAGAGSTLTILWMLCGWAVMSAFKEQSALNAQVTMHIHDDKVTSKDDVRELVRRELRDAGTIK
jgi:hypothetical protein